MAQHWSGNTNVRRMFSQEQRRALLEEYAKTKSPSIDRKRELAQQIDLTEKQVKNWFYLTISRERKKLIRQERKQQESKQQERKRHKSKQQEHKQRDRERQKHDQQECKQQDIEQQKCELMEFEQNKQVQQTLNMQQKRERLERHVVELMRRRLERMECSSLAPDNNAPSGIDNQNTSNTLRRQTLDPELDQSHHQEIHPSHAPQHRDQTLEPPNQTLRPNVQTSESHDQMSESAEDLKVDFQLPSPPLVGNYVRDDREDDDRAAADNGDDDAVCLPSHVYD